MSRAPPPRLRSSFFGPERLVARAFPRPASVSPFSASPGHGDSAAPLSSLRDLRASQERCRGTHACDFKLFSSYVLTKKK